MKKSVSPIAAQNASARQEVGVTVTLSRKEVASIAEFLRDGIVSECGALAGRDIPGVLAGWQKERRRFVTRKVRLQKTMIFQEKKEFFVSVKAALDSEAVTLGKLHAALVGTEVQS